MTFVASGTGIVGGITVTAPAGFEVSTTPGGASGFGNTATINGSGTIASTTVYVRLAAVAGNNVGNTYGGNVTLESGDHVATNSVIISTSSITQRPLTANSTIASRPYDGTTTPGAITLGTITGLQFGQTLVITPSATAYGSKDLGTRNTTISYLLADGTGLASNYNMADFPTTGAITARILTITGVTADDRQYNGTANTTATLNTGSAVLNVVVGTEDVTIDATAATGTFTPNGNVGAGKTVTTSGFALAGADKDNYTLTQPSTTASITGAPLTITATDPAKTYGTALTTINNSATGFTATPNPTGIGSETVTTVTLTPDAAGTSATTVAGASYVVTPSNATGTGGFLASNYIINYVPFNGTVAQAPLTITANPVNKVFGNILTGSSSAAFTPSGLRNGETISSVTITYVPVAPSGLSGAGATDPVGTYTGSIQPSAATGGTFNPSNYTINYVNGNVTVTSLTACSPTTVFSDNFDSYANGTTTGSIFNGSPKWTVNNPTNDTHF
jgi:hypothetical protein